MKRYIVLHFVKAGYHYWPRSKYPELARKHKHLFAFEITIETFIYPTGDPTGTTQIIDKHFRQYRLCWDGYGSTMILQIRTTAEGKTLAYSFGKRTNEWFHLVATYSSITKEIKIFENSVLKAIDTWSGTLVSTTYPVCMGRFTDGPYDWFQGLFAFARIYNRALTEREIKAHYHYLTKPMARVPI